jgi:translocation and assembly module TamB
VNNSTSPTTPERPQASSSQGLWTALAWTAGGVAVLLISAVAVVAVLLQSEQFHNYVLNRVQKEASTSLGVRVQVQNFAVNLATLNLDIYGITVDGASPYSNPPLLQLDHAAVGVRVVSFLQRKWYLDNVRVDRPIVRIFVDEHGVSNLPTVKSSGDNSSNTNLFDLGIRHALLDQGEIYYNDKQSPLSADLHNLDFSASLDSSQQKYSGHLAYSDGHLVSGTLHPIPHNLDAEFDATPTTFHLTKAKLSSDNSQLNLTATLQGYSHPILDAQYDATVDGNQVRQILKDASVPTGLVRATGNIHFQQQANRTLLDSLLVQGDLNSSQLDVRTPSLRTQVRNLSGHYSLANGNGTLQDLHANLLGGYLTASGTMAAIGGDSKSKVNAKLSGVSLAELKRLASPSSLPGGATLGGVVNAQATASWGKNLDSLVAQADATINGRITGVHANGAVATTQATVIPINSAIHGRYSAGNKQLAFTQSYLRTPQTSLTMNGVVSNRSSLALRLQADDLREIETVADLFRSSPPGHPLRPLGLAGTASFDGTVQGSTTDPHLSGKLVASNLHLNGSQWKVLRTDVELSPSLVSLQHADLEPASRGRIAFDARATLVKWSFSTSNPVEVDLNASQVDLADLEKLGGQQFPVSGTINANVKLRGTALSPSGAGNILLNGVTAYDQPIQSVKLAFTGTGDEIHGNLAVQLPSGSLQSTISVRPQQRTYVAKISASGIQLNKLQALRAHNVDATGTLSLDASGQGSFDNPEMNATLQIPQLTIQQQTITGLSLHMNVADHFGNATLVSSAVNTSIRAMAKVNLTGDYETDATLDTQSIPLQPLIAIYAPTQAADVKGQTEVHATLHGPLKNKNLIEAHVTIPVLQLAYSNTVQLAEASPIHIDYKNGVVELQRAAIRGTNTDLQFQGSIPTVGNAPMSLLLLGTVNLKLAQLLNPDVRSSGELKFNINSYGGSGGPSIGGEIDVVDASYASVDMPVGLQHGNGVLTLTKDRINISKFQGTVSGGTLTAQGGVTYQPQVQFNLGLAAQGVRLLYPQGVRESIDANLRFAGTTDNALLGGSVNISDLSFTPAFDLNDFISQFSGGVAAPPSQGFTQNVQLNLAVRSTSDVNLVSRTLSVGGSANLQVRGTAANPVILGRVNLNSGDVILNGSRFVLNGGTVQFVNPSETQPVVNVSLSTNIQQYNIFLRFNGPVNQLRTEYNSDPSLPTADIINLLAFGQTTEASSTTTMNPEGIVASQVSSQVTSRVSKIAGISQLSINPVLAGSSNQGPPGANITVQQRVTGNLFVTFSSNVASTQSQTIQGQYQVSPRVAVSATRDQNGGFAVDALIKKTW